MLDFVGVWKTEHKLYKKLARDPVILNHETTITGILTRIEFLARSCVLGTGGWLFESYILRCGMTSDREMLQKQILKNIPFDDWVIAHLVRSYSVQFWYQVITSIHKVNKFACEPLQMFTLLLEYHGLSRLGTHLLAFCGGCLLPRTNDRNRDTKLVQYDEESKKFILEGKAVIAFDNYSHSFGSAAMRLNKGTHMNHMNVTVGGLSIMKHPVDQSFVLQRGEFCHSIPSSKAELEPFVEVVLDRLCNALVEIQQETKKDFSYFEIARCVREDIETVPLTSREVEKEDSKIEDHFDLHSFRPLFVSDRNSAENEGMAHLMSYIFNLCIEVIGNHKYVYVRMDAAVFCKWLRVNIFL